ncbi:MAG: hypothetical protein HY814_01685 [Candidatus Riflebacteria bacterium]|nr:hypothetical protein [Candidatus Riflebacteria bacterium]
MTSVRGDLVVAGALAQKPGVGGHTWQFLQYLLGFQRLGWRVLFVDRLGPGMCRDAAGHECRVEESFNLAYFLEVMERFGLSGSFSLACDVPGGHLGVSRKEVLERTARSAILLNVMGFLQDEAILAAAPKRVFLDTDPGFGQMWHALGQADLFSGHTAHVTIGENIGKPDCELPTCSLPWLVTPQPVVLEAWPVTQAPADARFTSIASWRGAYGPVELNGKRYGLRVHELHKFAWLPRGSARPFELALALHPADEKDRAMLAGNGWSLVEPKLVARDPWAYRDFIQASHAEILIAKGIYVQTRSGWVSERSLCYLASGKPVVAQDTGLAGLYPTGAGLLTFTTPEEASCAIEAVEKDYARHCRAARELAVEHSDSDKVLGRLLAKLGVA